MCRFADDHPAVRVKVNFIKLPQVEEKMEGLNVTEDDDVKERVVSDDGVFTVSMLYPRLANIATISNEFISKYHKYSLYK